MKILIVAFTVASLLASFARTENDGVCTAQGAPKSTVAPIDLDAYAQETPSPTEYTLPEVVIVASAPKAHHTKVWTCGPMQENLVGGYNRTCEWK